MAGSTGIGERVNSMVDLARHAAIAGNAKAAGQTAFGKLLGESERRKCLRALQSAMADALTTSIVFLGDHGDDRIELVRAVKRTVGSPAEPIHVIGTAYAQHLTYGALAFLLSGLDSQEELSPTNVMRAISRHPAAEVGRPVVVVQYPQLLDAPSRAVLAQMTHNSSILLVVLAEQAEFLPPEFIPVSSGRGHQEIRLGAMSLDEVHETLQKEFDAVPSPLATASMWRQSQGNPGWLHALGQDALAHGKLVVSDGYLLLGRGPWPRGGQLESMALSQIAVLDAAQKKLLTRIAADQPLPVRALANEELVDLDHLIGWGFVRRHTEHRQLVVLGSKLLAGMLHPDTRLDGHGLDGEPAPAEGNFHAFIAGESLLLDELSRSPEAAARNLFLILEQLRQCLLGGEMQRASALLKRILEEFLDSLSPTLVEILVMVGCIIDVVGDNPGNDVHVLESLLSQLDRDEAGYDRWLVKSTLSHLRNKDQPAPCNALEFHSRWNRARWWFSDLLSGAETARTARVGWPPRGLSRRETMDALVALHHGERAHGAIAWNAQAPDASALEKAVGLLLTGTEATREEHVLAALELLVADELSIFALPRSNRILAGISVSGQLAVAGWLKQRRKGSTVHSRTDGVDLLVHDSPVLEVLTKREKFVASAAAQGLNNQQIARDAGVSIRTVEGHLYQIYSKLAVGGRRELSTLVAALRVDDQVAR